MQISVGGVLRAKLPTLALGVKAFVFTFNKYLERASDNCNLQKPASYSSSAATPSLEFKCYGSLCAEYGAA